MQANKRNIVCTSPAILIQLVINLHRYEASADKQKRRLLQQRNLSQKQQHLLFAFFNLKFAVTACPVQMSDGQRFLSPMSGLLFCTTCCLAQPCLEGWREGGEGPEDQQAKEEMICHPRFVTVPHQNPSSQPPLVIPGVDWQWGRSGIRTPPAAQKHKVWTVGWVCSVQLAGLKKQKKTPKFLHFFSLY